MPKANLPTGEQPSTGGINPQQQALISTPIPTAAPQTFTYDGVLYTPVQSTPQTPAVPSFIDPLWPPDSAACANFTDSSPNPPSHYRTYLAHALPLQTASIEEVIDDAPAGFLDTTSTVLTPQSPESTSIDWTQPWPSTYATSLSNLSIADKPFIFDSSATCHITPECSDFSTFRPISSHPVAGLGSSSVPTVGCGSVDLLMSDRQKLTLFDVLFIQSSDVCLVSVHCHNTAGN
jgi:hypothetical protein